MQIERASLGLDAGPAAASPPPPRGMSFVLEKNGRPSWARAKLAAASICTMRVYRQASSAHPGFCIYIGDVVVRGVQCYFRIPECAPCTGAAARPHAQGYRHRARRDRRGHRARPQAQSEPHRFEQLTFGKMNSRFFHRVNSASPSGSGAPRVRMSGLQVEGASEPSNFGSMRP